MGRAADEVARAYGAWARALGHSEAAVERARHERQCRHSEAGAAGAWYAGAEYLAALQRLRGREALRLASHVRPFFWADAPRLRIRLCQECATALRLQASKDGSQ